LRFMREVFGAEEKLKKDARGKNQACRDGDSSIISADSIEQSLRRIAGMFIYVEDATPPFEMHWQKAPSPSTIRLTMTPAEVVA